MPAAENDVKFTAVEFQSQDATLRGRLYRPSAGGLSPAVVMAHGTTGTITMTTDRYAEVFRAAGLAVLLFDHRNFGASGGEPRQEINPWIQARGYRDAITYISSVSGIDRNAIALWGDSDSAPEAIVAAAADARTAAVVVQVPAIGREPPRRIQAARSSPSSPTRSATVPLKGLPKIRWDHCPSYRLINPALHRC